MTRLSDEELVWLEKRTNDECPPQLARYFVSVIAEVRWLREQNAGLAVVRRDTIDGYTRRLENKLRDRRAQDLSDEDREALTFAKERVSFNLNASAASEYFSDAYADRHRHAIAVLSKLLDGGREGK